MIRDIIVNKKLENLTEADFGVDSKLTNSVSFLVKEGFILNCNSKFADLIGFRLDQINNGIKIQDFIFSDDLQKFANLITKLESSDSISSDETIRFNANMNKLLTTNLKLTKNFYNNQLGFLGSISEIFDNSQADISQHVLAKAINTVSEGIVLTHLDGTIFFVNESITKILGISQNELLTKNINTIFQEFLDPNEYQKFNLNDKSENRKNKLICKKRDGTHLLILLKRELVKDKNNEPITELFTITDIFEKEGVKLGLSSSESKYSKLFEKMHDAFASVKIITDEHDNPQSLLLLESNKAFEQLFKISAEKRNGQNTSLNFVFLENIEPNPFPIIAKAALKGSEERFEFKVADQNNWYSVSVYSPEKGFAFIIIHDITKQKSVQEEYSRSKQMLRSILDNIPQRVFWKDVNSNFLGCNIHFAKDMGIDDPDEIVGKNEYDFNSSKKAAAYIKSDKFIIETGQSIKSSDYKQYIKNSRSNIWVRMNKLPLKDEENKVRGVVGTYEDISNQRKVEENLRKLSQAVEQSPVSILITDTKGKIEYVNPKFSEVTGYSFQEVFEKNPRILKSGETNTEAYKEMWKTIISGKEWTGEFHNKKKNGELYWENATISSIKDNNGVITHFLAVKEDITERKLAEEVLQESERLLRDTQAIAGLGSYVLDISKGIWQSSTILDDIFGIDEKFVRSVEGWISLVHPDWRATMVDYFSNDVLKQHARFNIEYKIIRKCDAQERWVHGLGELEFDSQNRPIKMLGTISDITERKSIQEALNYSFSLLEGTLESTIDGILVVDQNGKIQRFNKKFLELWRIPESIIQTKDDDAALNFVLAQLKYPDQFLNKVKELYKDTLAESIDVLEFTDGRIFERFSRPQLVDNKAVGRVWSFRDITDKKIAEETLIESEKKFRTVIEEANEIVFTVDNRGYFTYVNPAGLKSSGYSLEEFKRLKYIDLIPPNHKQKVQRNYYRQYLERTESSATEYPIKTKSGEIKWFNQNARLIIENKEVKGFYVIARDTTERRKAEEALRESEEKFRTLFETSNEGILVTDVDEKNILVNPRMVEMTGYSLEELVKMNFQQLILPEELESHFLMHENRKKGDSEIYERKLLRKDGFVIWTLVSASPILNKEGKYIGSFGMFMDITEQKKMMEELIIAKEKAEEVNRLKSLFLSNISHELRTPLIGILGYAETLYNEIDNSEFKEMASILLKSGIRLKETLNLLLDLSHIEADKLQINLSQNNLTKLINEKFKKFHAAVEAKGLKFHIILEEEDIEVRADERMLSQVIEHLLTNAIKYTHKGEIVVAISRISENQKQYAEIKIKDTGIGIPQEMIQLIFEPFRQASEGLSRMFEGIGLGLTVAKKFIELMGGEIFIESDANQGSTFIVKLPIEIPSSYSSTIKESVNIKPITNKGAINYKYSSEVLLIEDDKPTANIIRFYLCETCKTDWVNNGQAAVEMAEKKKYSAILADINLGLGMDGIETINKIKKIDGYNSIPIIAVTAYALHGDREKFLSQGCNYYISKPFGKDELVKLVDKILQVKQ